MSFLDLLVRASRNFSGEGGPAMVVFCRSEWDRLQKLLLGRRGRAPAGCPTALLQPCRTKHLCCFAVGHSLALRWEGLGGVKDRTILFRQDVVFLRLFE